jgi:hypothetical protein
VDTSSDISWSDACVFLPPSQKRKMYIHGFNVLLLLLLLLSAVVLIAVIQISKNINSLQNFNFFSSAPYLFINYILSSNISIR